MPVSADRAFLRVLLVALAIAGFLGTVSLLLFVGIAPARSGLMVLRCLIDPVSSFDVVLHSSALGTTLLAGFGLLAGWRAGTRERAVAVEMRYAARKARLPRMPPRIVPIAHAVNVADQLDVVDVPRPFAFVYGWALPRICISMGLIDRLTDREVEAVLYHERWHLLQRDPIRLVAIRVIAATFPFVPPIRQLVHQCVLATELAADQHAVAAMGQPRWLASALAKVLDHEQPTTVPALAGLTGERIAALAGEPVQIPSGLGRASAVILFVEFVALAAILLNGGAPLIAGFGLHPVC